MTDPHPGSETIWRYQCRECGGVELVEADQAEVVWVHDSRLWPGRPCSVNVTTTLAVMVTAYVKLSTVQRYAQVFVADEAEKRGLPSV